MNTDLLQINYHQQNMNFLRKCVPDISFLSFVRQKDVYGIDLRMSDGRGEIFMLAGAPSDIQPSNYQELEKAIKLKYGKA